ncbi:MAG: AIM24 family protein, partial [Verrucomicrobiae bacterium]|nr:AIM24 family protein [Verrucomicrobiae bacterium]
VFTDPNATIAWSANLEPKFKSDISFKTFLGRSSGETFQMHFEGDGFVVVQPYEEVYMATVR